MTRYSAFIFGLLVLISSGLKAQSDSLSIPSSFVDTLHIELTLTHTAVVDLKFFNRWGEEIRHPWKDTTLAAGTHYTTIDSSGLKIDNYVYHCTIDSIAINGHVTHINQGGQDSIYSFYPNPFCQEIIVAYELAQAKKVGFTILDLTGKVIKQVEDSVVKSGQRTITFDLHDRPQGLYVLQCTFDSSATKTFKAIKSCDASGIDDLNSPNQIAILPNPVKDQLPLPENYTGSLEIIDLSGRLIKQLSVTGSDVLDLSHIPAAEYLFRLTSGDKSIVNTQKIIVQH